MFVFVFVLCSHVQACSLTSSVQQGLGHVHTTCQNTPNVYCYCHCSDMSFDGRLLPAVTTPASSCLAAAQTSQQQAAPMEDQLKELQIARIGLVEERMRTIEIRFEMWMAAITGAFCPLGTYFFLTRHKAEQATFAPAKRTNLKLGLKIHFYPTHPPRYLSSLQPQPHKSYMMSLGLLLACVLDRINCHEITVQQLNRCQRGPRRSPFDSAATRQCHCLVQLRCCHCGIE